MVQAINNTNNKQSKPINGVFAVPSILLPKGERNYCLFNQNKISFIVSQKELALPQLKQVLKTSNDEKEIIEALYIVDKLIDNGTKGIPAMYPLLAKFNDTESSSIQAYLAGIYRKTQVPDAFGPLIKMLLKNSKPEQKNPTFDPNEEIGGAILEYIRNYSNNPKAIDYSV